MRIRKRLADLHRGSEAALITPSDPLQNQPSLQSMAIPTWVFSNNKNNRKTTQDKMKQEDFVHYETFEEKKSNSTSNDIRKIVNIINEDDVTNMNLQPSNSAASAQGSWYEGDYKVVPLKKRRGSFARNNRNDKETIMSATMKSKTNNKCGHGQVLMQVNDHEKTVEEETNGTNNSLICSGGAKKIKRGNVIMEGSRCSRVNGRGWRCCNPTLVGYSLCEHHLGKGRLRSATANVPRSSEDVAAGGGGEPRPPSCGDNGSCNPPLPPLVVTKKRTKVGVVKARSMSSLLEQI